MRRAFAALRCSLPTAAIAVLLGLTGQGAAAPPIRVVVNSAEVTLTPPATHTAGHVVAPLKPILASMGCTLLWDAKTKTLTAVRGRSVLRLWPGKREALLDGRTILLPLAPMLRGGVVCGPVRPAAAALGAAVTWDASRQRLQIAVAGTQPLQPPVGAVTREKAIAIATEYLKSINCYPKKVIAVEAHEAQAPANNYWEEVAGRGKIVSGAPLRPCWIVHFDYESFVPAAWMEVYVDAVTGKVVGGQQTR